MNVATFTGVYPILVTPFDEQARIDEESLRRLVEFCLVAGVHGLGIALGSEIYKLSEAERVRVTRIVVDQVKGRVPVVVNTSAAGADLATLYSRLAEENGANALMVSPPSFAPPTPQDVVRYFQMIDAAVSLPIFMQDTAGTPISADVARQIAGSCEHVRWIKVESPPTPLKVAEAATQGAGLLTVFGGAGGNNLLEELRRGARGTMPGCSQPEAFVAVWNHWHSGRRAAARALMDRVVAPVNRLAAMGWGAFYTVHKEILRQRGVIRTAVVRCPAGPPLDATSQEELAEIITLLNEESERLS